MTDRRENARGRMILEHYSLCRAAAMRFIRPGLERADLEQTAAIGLIKAADRFDHTLGTPFSAFAWPFIVGELMHHVRDHEHLVRFPRSLHDIDRRESRVYERLTVRLGRLPTREEISAESAIPPRLLEALACARVQRAAHMLGCDPAQYGHAATARIDDRAALSSSIDMLEPSEQAIILGIYGLRLTQTEVGQKIGCSQRSASRLHRRALTKLAAVFQS